MIVLKKILCPVDHSECSYLALKYAISLALKDEAKLYLMHVIDTRLYDTEIYKFSPYKLNEIDMSKIRADLMKSLPEGTTDVLGAALAERDADRLFARPGALAPASDATAANDDDAATAAARAF